MSIEISINCTNMFFRNPNTQTIALHWKFTKLNLQIQGKSDSIRLWQINFSHLINETSNSQKVIFIDSIHLNLSVWLFAYFDNCYSSSFSLIKLVQKGKLRTLALFKWPILEKYIINVILNFTSKRIYFHFSRVYVCHNTKNQICNVYPINYINDGNDVLVVWAAFRFTYCN